MLNNRVALLFILYTVPIETRMWKLVVRALNFLITKFKLSLSLADYYCKSLSLEEGDKKELNKRR